MTDSILLATTRQRGLHAVGTAGQPVMRAYDQITRYLEQTLSPAHAALFAEPNPNAARGTVDWYTDATGSLTRFIDADEERQAAVSARLAVLRDEIEAAATQLTRSKEGGERFLGQMLKLALEIPGKEFVYVVGDQPILVCWGNLHDTPQAERGVLQRMVRASASAVPLRPAAAGAGAAGVGGAAAAAGVAGMAGGAAAAAMPLSTTIFRYRIGWLAGLLWLLFALLLFAVFFVLLSGCGVGPRWLAERSLVNFCPLPIVGDLQDERDLLAEQNRTDVLEEELYRLRLEIAQSEVRCRREARLVPSIPVPDEPRPEDPVIVAEADPEPPEVLPPADERLVIVDEDAAPVEEGDAVVPPEDVVEEPVEVAEVPEDIVDVPEEVAEVREDVVEVPEEVAEVPEDVVEVPEEVVPEDVAEVPEDVAEVPEDVAEVPEDVAEVPEDVTQVPEDVVEQPEEVAEIPTDPSVVPPDAETPVDDARLPPEVGAPPETEPPADTTPPREERTPEEEAEDNAAFDERLEREGGEQGRVNVTLMWNSDADLDLRVSCPSGQEISFEEPGACGGALDVDMNAVGGRGPMSDEPVENVVWEGNASPGRYIVRVDNYESRSDGNNPTPFRLRIVNGDESEIIEGSIREQDGPVAYYEFVVP